jgi:hypothetical protein
MTTFRFITVGENLGTRKLGEETRNKLLPLLLGEGQVVLDFEGVNDFARKNISVAFKRRYLALNSKKRNEFASEEQ